MNYKPINECTTVYELLEDPSRWTQGFYARDKDGNKRMGLASTAVCFCLTGAIQKIENSLNADIGTRFDMWDKLVEIYESKYSNESRIMTIVRWQDLPERTHAEVLELVREAGI